ncbi:molybdopterin molybdotransferase MoeA [Streptomyces aculeolatus]|uniref:molybdopterin molybdotransferase MoeA n=1 Tax=Streptomyces aculeolatus TaxID=270689 RepID=UPI0021F1A9F3|nr:molybdopterin molybdotransferase MoeA [Streptomyces aculeolatus]
MTSGRRGDRRTPGAGAGSGSGNRPGGGSGSDGETGARGDEFADALALANDRRDLAATYGDAFTLADAPPPAVPPGPGTSRGPARTDESGDALSLTDRDTTSAERRADRAVRETPDRGDDSGGPSARSRPGHGPLRRGGDSAAGRGGPVEPGPTTGSGARPEERAAPGGYGRSSRGRAAGPAAPEGGPRAGTGSAAGADARGAGVPDGAGPREWRARAGHRPRAGAAGGGAGEAPRAAGARRADAPAARGGAEGGGDPLDVALGLDGRARPEPRDPRGLSWDAARRVAVRAGRRLGAVAVPVAGAYGQVLADPLKALVDLPPFDTSAMDGYAVAGPGPWRLDSAGPGILAGHAAHPPLPDGHAVRIATGARVPPGATGVLRSEHAELRDGGSLYATGATAAQDVRTGQDIRPRGQECRAGVELLPAGERVTPAVLGLAAAAGHDELRVVRRPRVEVLVLGAELLHRGLPRDGRIRDALGPMLDPWLRACGAEPFVTRRLGDDAELLYEAVATSTADVVVTTGGTAAGPVDHVHATLRRLKADLLVDGVAVRPGHPMLLAVLPTGAYVVGLPGNPLAAVSGLLTLAEPLVRVLGGAAPGTEPPEAVLTADAKGHPTDTRLVPVAMEHGTGAQAAAAQAAAAQTAGKRRPAGQHPAAPRAGGQPAAHPLHFTGPAMLRGLAVADALAVVPPGGAAAGAPVRVLRLPWTAAPAAAAATAPTTPAGPA